MAFAYRIKRERLFFLDASSKNSLHRRASYQEYEVILRNTSNSGDWGLILTFVGHSLGGGMASANAYATGRSAITFNAAGLHPNTDRDLNLNKIAKVDAYIVAGEIVDHTQKLAGLVAAGTRHYLKASYLPAPPYPYPFNSSPAIFIQRAMNHRIGTVIQKMRSQGIH